jgi:hypothetical protein
MPYGGCSVIGLINLLNEVAMPQTNNATYDLSTPAKAEVFTPTYSFVKSAWQIFAFLVLAKTMGGKKEKLPVHIQLTFIVPSP